MNKTMKLYSSLAAAIMLSTSFLVPMTHAETYNQKEDQLFREFQLQHSHLFTMKDVSTPTDTTQTQVSTQAIYKQQIEADQIHGYIFKTSGGSFTVKTLDQQTGSGSIAYHIYNVDSDNMLTPSSTGDISLPAGTYDFLVASISDQPITYNYELDGPFSVEPDTTLPSLQVTSPTLNQFRVQKGSSSDVTFTGTSNADQLTLTNGNADINLGTTGTFNQKMTLKNGMNDLVLTATGPSGNVVTYYYSITLPGVSRFQGNDRYEVSSAVSQELISEGANTSGTIIIAKGDVFSDALSGGPLATVEDAPILLTPTKALPDSVIGQIKTLAPTKAIILGGTSSVSTNIETQLKSLGVTTIDRVSAKDRYGVAATVADRISGQTQSDTAIIASGEVFPDALSACTIAGPNGMPILLVQSGTVPDSIQTYIKNHPEVKNFVVVGGTATVKDSVITKIKALRSGAIVDRISGKDRYDLSIKVAEYGIEHYQMDMTNVAIARGDSFADALSGAPLANYLVAPILLTPTTKLDSGISSFLSAHSSEIDNMYIFGGTASVSQNTETQLNSFIK
ncbi:MAG: cell wall-binding repeat-containing protein [Bacillota bacterium]|nr:cell wall-binding repeat-containing protein [Bacillota bacterium]